MPLDGTSGCQCDQGYSGVKCEPVRLKTDDAGATPLSGSAPYVSILGDPKGVDVATALQSMVSEDAVAMAGLTYIEGTFDSSWISFEIGPESPADHNFVRWDRPLKNDDSQVRLSRAAN